MRLDDPAYLSRRIANITAWSNRIERSLSDYVPAAADEVRAMQIAEQKRLADWLRDKAVQPLAEVESAEAPAGDTSELRRKLDKVATELERIEAAIERIPSIGLVTDRGAS